MLKSTQWSNPPDGASGSSTISTKLLTAFGASLHLSDGEMSCLSQVYFVGMVCPSANASVAISMFIVSPPSFYLFLFPG